MKSNLSNPIIPHAPQSLEREEMRMQLFINRIAKRIIRMEMRENPKGFHLWIIKEKSILPRD